MFQSQVLKFATHDVKHLGDLAGGAGGGDAKEARVGVAVVEGDAGFDPAVLVQDVGVEAGVHAFSGAAGGEGAASAEEGLEGCEGVDVGGGDGEGFEGEVDVGEVGEGGVCGDGEVGEGEETAGVVGGGDEVVFEGVGG